MEGGVKLPSSNELIKNKNTSENLFMYQKGKKEMKFSIDNLFSNIQKEVEEQINDIINDYKNKFTENFKDFLNNNNHQKQNDEQEHLPKDENGKEEDNILPGEFFNEKINECLNLLDKIAQGNKEQDIKKKPKNPKMKQ